ncbi:MAG: DNA repair protein RecO [Candidatus Omnitrophica bacterium]|nr:DNA repair protein RecO [Candidatus Omnitrophota bacterium]
MAIQKTDAIILRRQEIRETSLILTAFTRDLGKIQGLVKGVRGARSAVPWYLEPLTLQTMILYERRRSPWSLVSACDLVDAFDPIRRDLTRISYASFCLDAVDCLTENGDPHPEIFHLLLNSLRGLAEGTDPRTVARFLEAHLLKAIGVLPDLESLALSPGGRLSLQQILQIPLGRLRLSHPIEEELRRILQGLLHNVVEKELRSRSFLRALGLERNPVSHSRESGNLDPRFREDDGLTVTQNEAN